MWRSAPSTEIEQQVGGLAGQLPAVADGRELHREAELARRLVGGRDVDRGHDVARFGLRPLQVDGFERQRQGTVVGQRLAELVQRRGVVGGRQLHEADLVGAGHGGIRQPGQHIGQRLRRRKRRRGGRRDRRRHRRRRGRLARQGARRCYTRTAANAATSAVTALRNRGDRCRTLVLGSADQLAEQRTADCAGQLPAGGLGPRTKVSGMRSGPRRRPASR